MEGSNVESGRIDDKELAENMAHAGDYDRTEAIEYEKANKTALEKKPGLFSKIFRKGTLMDNPGFTEMMARSHDNNADLKEDAEKAHTLAFREAQAMSIEDLKEAIDKERVEMDNKVIEHNDFLTKTEKDFADMEVDNPASQLIKNQRDESYKAWVMQKMRYEAFKDALAKRIRSN